MITRREIHDAFREIELIRQKVNGLYFKMEDHGDTGDVARDVKRYVDAKHMLDTASTVLLRALDKLR